MFNRALEVKMIKKPKDDVTDEIPTDILFEQKTKIIGRQVDKTVVKVGAVVVIYVLLDTFRRVMVVRANND